MRPKNKQKTIEELLAVLERKKDPRLTYNDDILNFITFYKLKSGKKRVPLSLLFDVYLLWSKKPIEKIDFNKRIWSYFNKYGGFTRLNISSMNLSEAAYASRIKKEDRIPLHQHKRVQAFLEKNQIKPGNYFVESFVLYKLFNNWLYKTKYRGNGIGNKKFVKIIRLYLIEKNNLRYLHFGVDPELEKTLLTPSRVAAIKRWQYKYGREKTNKKK